jgi:hypothetical protein
LSDVILKVLADNGKHFTILSENERITVAITFRGAANCTNCHQNPWQAAPNGPSSVPSYPYPVPSNPGYKLSDPTSPPVTTAPGTTAAPTDKPMETAAWQSDFKNDTLLGDLHLKQGKGQEAAAAYLKALTHLETAIDHKRFSEKGYIPGDLPILLASVDLMNKVAQAYVVAGDDEAARKALQNSARLAKEAETLAGGAATTANPKSVLPTKLVVTVSKKQLDLMGDGKMTFEMFCKAATIECTAPPAEKK